MKKLLFLVLLILFVIINLYTTEDEIKVFEGTSLQKIKPDIKVRIAKLSGIRKAGSSLLWVKHGLQIGDIIEKSEEKSFKVNQLYQNSLNIAYLDPYFKQNYYTSSAVLAFIRTLKAHEEALEILQVGISNNPSEKLFKRYAGAIIASSKNDTEKLISVIEEILQEKFDEELILFLVKVYEKKYSETGNSFYQNKIISLLELLFKFGTEKSKKTAVMKLDDLKVIE